jgi:Kdo2-lipid IVA lauroyltransferase/acyltransferase
MRLLSDFGEAWRAGTLRRSVVHIAEYAAFRLAFGAIRLLPLDLAADILATATRIVCTGTRRHRRALANLKCAFPDMPEHGREAIALAMWENVGRVIAEAAHLDRFLAEPHRLDCTDMRELDEYLPRRGLYFVASLHTGNWEIGLLHSQRRGYRPAAFYRTVANPYVDRFLKASRERIYEGGLFPVRGEMAGKVPAEYRSRQLVAALRTGVPIGILADHHDGDGILVPFFGQGVRVSRAAATLALQFGARLSVARSIRLGRQSRFVGEAIEIPVVVTGNRQADIQTLTTVIMGHFEDWIRQFPEQWLWSQAPFVDSDGVYMGSSLEPVTGIRALSEQAGST